MIKKTRTEILVAVLAAYQGIAGDLTEEEAERGFAIVENEFDCDLDAVAAHLRSQERALSLACAVMEY